MRVAGLEILGEGVYCPATRTMHLVGCKREKFRREAIAFEDGIRLAALSYNPLNLSDFESDSWTRRCQVENETLLGYGNSRRGDNDTLFGYGNSWSVERSSDPCGGSAVDYFMKSAGVCDLSVTLQYPPLMARWNSQRVLKTAVRLEKEEDPQLERSLFFPYPYHQQFSYMLLQQRLETGASIGLLLLGLACVGLQIRHGRSHEESLPFVSLAMLGIQITHHVSQTAFFKDLQIHRFTGYSEPLAPSVLVTKSRFNLIEDFSYYGNMALHEYVPYQAMAITAIFMYVWIFHRVGDRRRIMQLRVRKGKPGARHPPSDGQLVCATLTIFVVVALLGIAAYAPDSNIFRVSSFVGSFAGASSSGSNLQWMGDRDSPISPGYYNDQFVSPKFYNLSEAQWGFVNKLTGLVVSLFLVPQLLGNWRWEVQGRPLSAWFYAGLPFLRSLPRAFTVAKHFQLLPIFACYDPYRDSLYGFYENPTPWWQIGVVCSSAVLVLAVHLQFATSFQRLRSQHSTAGVSYDGQTCEEL